MVHMKGEVEKNKQKLRMNVNTCKGYVWYKNRNVWSSIRKNLTEMDVF